MLTANGRLDGFGSSAGNLYEISLTVTGTAAFVFAASARRSKGDDLDPANLPGVNHADAVVDRGHAGPRCKASGSVERPDQNLSDHRD